MSTKDVFISYKAEEFDDANWVKSILENNGISCWMAPMCIPGGSSYAMEIPQAIRGCKVFVLILSEKSQKSKWVPRELDQAINEGKTVLPFMLENCALKDDFNFYLTNVQRYAAYESKTAAVEKMLREINAIIGAKAPIADSTPAPAPAPEPEPKQRQEIKPEPKPKPAPPAPAPKKEAKASRPKKEKKKGIKRFIPLIAVGGALMLIALIVIIAVVVSNANRITVAGVECDRGATTIYIDGAKITATDLEKAKKLEYLEVINFENCTLPADIGSLFTERTRNVTMKDCSLTDSQIATVDFSKTQISDLDLSGNEGITDIEFIAYICETLKTLKLDRIGAENYCPVENATELSELSLRGNGIEDATFVSSLLKLRFVDLGENSLSDVSFLKGLTFLEKVTVDSNSLTDLSGLETAIKLSSLSAGKNQLTSLKGLENTTVLKNVYLNDNQLSNVSLLKNSVAALMTVDLRGNKLYSLECLAGAADLRQLYIDNNGITNLDFLSDSTMLTTLTCSDNTIIRIDALSNCTKLNTLDLSGNISVSGELCLDNASFDGNLDLSGTNISGLTVKSGKFNYLSVYDSGIKDYSWIYASSGHRLAVKYNENIDFAALKEAGFTFVHVLDCPLNKQLEVTETLGGFGTTFETTEEFKNNTEKEYTDRCFSVS